LNADGSPEVLLATAEGSVVVVDKGGAQDQLLDNGFVFLSSTSYLNLKKVLYEYVAKVRSARWFPALQGG